ncbi:hypothetical protein EX30DRAFT_341371 [Ascodesmis nigricans]|uniref:VWFA domain-containing protein n=1 Tax=Ascodesmis nigricans TaxID=341454 RepID=A0A4S2MVX4_9PEZI|nr:hypothetical protein EX30DRAFT_341371 [Ascodesmis nigricans]
MASFSIRRYLGLDGSDGIIKHNNLKHPIPDDLLDRLDKDLNDLITHIVGAKKSDKKAAEIQEPKTAAEFTQHLENFVAENNLDEFYPPGDPVIAEIAKKAEELINSPDGVLNSPKEVKERAQHALYRVVLYCDDSWSMIKTKTERRHETQANFCKLVADYILPLNVQGGLSLRWINDSPAHDGLTNSDEIAQIVKAANYVHYTPIGKGLKNHVLTPLWTNYLKTQRANGKRPRPLLVIIITDGWPYEESKTYFKEVILQQIKELEAEGFRSRVIKYQMNQIGNEAESEDFIRDLLDTPEIKKNMRCTSERLESKLSELQENKAGLQEWFHKLLTPPQKKASSS